MDSISSEHASSSSWAAGRALGAGRSEELIRDGHVVVPGALPTPADAAAAADAVLSAAQHVLARCAACPNADDVTDPGCRGCHRTRSSMGPKSFNKARNVARWSERARAVVHSPRLLGLAAGLLGVDRVRVYQDSVFEKEPGDVESGWHQDTAAAPLASDRVVTVWVALADVGPEQGTLTFANGSHLAAGDGVTARGVPMAGRVAAVRHLDDADLEALGYAVVPPRALRAGDATAHLGWTFHRAPPNTGARSRPALAVTFYADGEPVPRDLLSPPGRTVAKGGARGVELETRDGVNVVLQLLSDDVSTWLPWAMDGRLVPGEPLAAPEPAPARR